jgi:hypothetical protein
MTKDITWAQHELVTEPYDPDYGSSQVVGDYRACPRCGAIVYWTDTELHTSFHDGTGGTDESA